jgi:DNA-binding transcriptional LysR family regulator
MTLPVSQLRNFDLNLLKVFDVVMAERSLTRAAQVLSLTQPAVSNALRRLREALGDEVLVRQGRSLQATPKALLLWPQVRETLARLQSALSPQPFSAAATVRSFVLTMADATASKLMPALVQDIMREAPGVSLRTVPLNTRDPRPMLEAGDVDLAVGHFPAALAAIGLQRQSGQAVRFAHQRLFSSDYVCVMRAQHPLAQTPLSLDAFCEAHHVLVSFSGRAYGLIDEALASVNRSRRVVLTVNQFFTTGSIVADSDLLAVMPRHFVQVTGFASQLAVRELPFEVPPIHVDSVWHQRHDNDSAQAWLRMQVQTAAQSLPPAAGGVRT